MQTLKAKGGPAPFIVDNHYGWNLIPYLQGFGGNVFAHAPDDLHPTLDTPEAIHAAEFFSRLLRDDGPDGALSYTYDQAVPALKAGSINYSTMTETSLVQMANPDSKVAKTCALAMMPAGPAGRFPNVAAHGWGIPSTAPNKDAAWAFITWAMSKQLLLRMFREHGYSSVTRGSMIELPEFRDRSMINGIDVAKIYLDTLTRAGAGYTVYRTVPPYPPVDHEIDVAVQSIVSNQMSAKEAMQRAQQNSVRALQRAGVKLCCKIRITKFEWRINDECSNDRMTKWIHRLLHFDEAHGPLRKMHETGNLGGLQRMRLQVNEAERAEAIVEMVLEDAAFAVLQVNEAERAEAIALRIDQRGAGVEAHPRRSGDRRIVGESRVQPGVLNHQQF